MLDLDKKGTHYLTENKEGIFKMCQYQRIQFTSCGL